MMQIELLDANYESRKSVLQEYYARYLTKVRGLSESSVKHYLDALNNISRRLKEKEIVSSDIYEIMDLMRRCSRDYVRFVHLSDGLPIEIHE